MAGKNQHHIPRSVLRGFLVESGTNAEQVVVYRRGEACFVSSIEGVAAERYFYSKPSPDGTKTLDDLITDYENRLGGLLLKLRAVPVGEPVDASIAAEVIVHLSSRTANIRQVFGYGMQRLIDGAAEAFSGAEAISKFIGLDQRQPGHRFLEALADTISKDPRFRLLDSLQIPKPVLDRILFALAKEGAAGSFAEQGKLVANMFSSLVSRIGDIVGEGHRQALAKSLAPEPRRQVLQQFEWRICAAPPEGAILPDCIALGVDRAGIVQPYMMAGGEKVSAVIMPLTSAAIVVGIRRGCDLPDLRDLNTGAAQCSHDMFIAASRNPDFVNLARLVGVRSISEMDQVASTALQELLPPSAGASIDAVDQPVTSVPERFSYHLNFIDCATEEEAAALGGDMKAIIGHAWQFLSLGRLDGITFASDYPAALRELDRGFTASKPLETVPEEIGYGVCQTAVVVRDGVKKAHIVMRGEYARALLGDDPEAVGLALHFLVGALAEVDAIECIDNACPGFLLSPVKGENLDDMLYLAVYPAILAYCSVRAGVGFGADEVMGNAYRDLTVAALDRADASIGKAKHACAADGDLDGMYHAGLGVAAEILTSLARVFGHCHGQERELFPQDDRVASALARRMLHVWAGEFAADLDGIWRTRSKWKSQQELYALNIHTERLLWQAGVIPWGLPQGGTYIRVLGLPQPVVAD